ncbi:MAG: hypothetical protein M5U12_38350 [Verrucomicrobia bacterium]|nr:hypothetical protein [Verrucomicrobiota bacterium]
MSKPATDLVDYEVGLQCRVNGEAWPVDAHHRLRTQRHLHGVWLVEGHQSRQPGSMVRNLRQDVYCDALQSVIEAVYDRAINDHNNRFIPLS